MKKKNVCVCDLLFLALKQRYRLLPVFGNMIVNNGWASLLFRDIQVLTCVSSLCLIIEDSFLIITQGPHLHREEAVEPGGD